MSVNLSTGRTKSGGSLDDSGVYIGGAEEDRLFTIERVKGTDFADRLVASAEGSELEGGGGDDLLFGLGGDDTLEGGDGDDFLSTFGTGNQLFGGDGDDILKSYGSDSVRLTISETINGGEGVDTVDFSEFPRSVRVDLPANFATEDRLFSRLVDIENVIATNFDDTVLADSSANLLQGRDGDDDIRARGGNDVIIGGRGADTIYGGEGSDRFLYARGHGDDFITDFDPGDDAFDVIKLFGFWFRF